ncbi:hypothetical protein OSTOST_11106, partial [Ostertagia ostertagi]
LIQEDTERAEKFLDELSKVYRYMLRNDEDPLVKLSIELQFITSYFALLKERYGEAVQLELAVTAEDREKCLPPLSLQVIVENALYQNKTSKTSPLRITIASGDNNTIVISNNVQRKILTETSDQESGLDNLIKKYQLMSEQPVEIRENGTERMIVLPLINKTMEKIRELHHSQQRLLHGVILRINTPEYIIHGCDHVMTLYADLIDVFLRAINIPVSLDPGHFAKQVDIVERSINFLMQVTCYFRAYALKHYQPVDSLAIKPENDGSNK